jgi:hypothetical protein
MDAATTLFSSIGNYLAKTDFAVLLQGVAAIWVATVATIALHTWRAQLRAEKQVAFIDQLTDTVHEFILLMVSPTSHLEYAQIGIQAHKGAAFGFEKYKNAEVIAYISKHGPDTSARILEQLAKVKPVLGKMRALVVKGQVLGLPDYARCQRVIEVLGWTHDHIEEFGAVISNQHLNWDHPIVQKSLDKLSKFDSARVRESLQEQNREFISFAKHAYEKATR